MGFDPLVLQRSYFRARIGRASSEALRLILIIYSKTASDVSC